MASSQSSGKPSRPKGCEVPRIWTKPLRKLTPRTSLGFECIQFASDVLGFTLMPHQRWLLIHALEVLGPISERNLRFRVLLILIGRQCGKTTLVKIINLWMLYMGMARLVLGAAQSLDIAREAWAGTVEIAEADAELRSEIEFVRRTNGEQCLTLRGGARYRITSATRGAGRGLSVDLLDWDEIREQRDWLAWAALSKTIQARPNGLILAISNAGDDYSVVLNQLRESGVRDVEAGTSTGIFEYSAEPESALDDWDAIAQGSPALGYPQGIPYEAIESALMTDPPAVFRTEVLCQRVESLDTPISPDAWNACADPSGTLQDFDGLHFCLDVAPDGEHATLAAAAMTDDGRVRVAVVAAWDNLHDALQELPGLCKDHKPRVLSWYPSGPAAAALASMMMLRGVKRVELKGPDVPAVCQGFAEQANSRMLIHSNDPLLTAHVVGSRRLPSGDGWRFQRRGGHADAAYAAAGAVHMVRTAAPKTRLKFYAV